MIDVNELENDMQEITDYIRVSKSFLTTIVNQNLFRCNDAQDILEKYFKNWEKKV